MCSIEVGLECGRTHQAVAQKLCQDVCGDKGCPNVQTAVQTAVSVSGPRWSGNLQGLQGKVALKRRM